MKATTKLLVLGVLGATAYGVVRAFRRSKLTASTDVDSWFDAADVHDISEISDTTDVEPPIVVTDEVVVITDAASEVDLELVPDRGEGETGR